MAEATAGPSVQRAPPVPDSIHEKAQKKKTQLEQKIRAILQNPLENALELLASEVDQWQKNLEDFESPLTVRSRERTLAEWEAHLLLTKPHLDVNMHWHKKTVLENAPGFLYTKVKVATATAEKTMKARTLSGWMGLLLNSITTYTRDDAGIKCGLHVLVRGGLYKTLKQSVITLIHQFKLDRYHNSKLYYGRYELERIINKILHSSRSQGREVALQHIVSFLCTFFFTSRASSLGPTHVKWRELDYFITLGDLTIYCNGFCDWDIDIRFGQFKTAIGTMQGLEQIFRACGVKLSHNVLFDITVALMAHLWAMGAFKKKYTRPEDLLEDTSRYQMELDPDMLHLPLFRAATPHGRRFIEPVRAAMSRSFGDAMSYWAGEAGLPRAGCTALRRDAGNLYGLQLGTKLAKDILNHHVTGVFRKSYSQNMQNLRLVGIRLGEDAGQKEAVAGDKLKEHNDRHVLASFAVEALVRDTRRDQEAEAAEADKTKREYKKSLDDGALKTEHESRTEAWEEYLKCFSVSAAGYQMGTANANKILERAVTGKEVKKEVLEFVKREDAPELYNKATAQPKLDAFLKAEKEYLKERTKLIREYTKNLKNAVNYDLLHTIKTGSPQERRAAADSLLTAHPSPHMAQAVEDALHQVRPAQNAHNIDDVRAWVKNLTQAAETTALNDYLEAQEAEGEENQLVQFLEKLDLNVPQDDIFSPPPPPPATTLTSLDVQLEDGAPDIDESQETDILKIPVTDMRRHMFMYYCHPIVIAREYAALQIDTADDPENANYRCPKCPLYIHRHPIPDFICISISKLERHYLYNHSKWHDLEIEMVDPDTNTFRCPAGDLSGASTVDEVREHAVTHCVNAADFRRLQQEATDALPARPAEPTYRNTREGRSNVKKDVHKYVDAGADEKPTQPIKPQVLALLSDTIEHQDSDDVTTAVEYLKEYLQNAAEDLGDVAAGGAQKEWDALELDNFF